VCGWVPHPQNNENCRKEEKRDQIVLKKKKRCIKIIASSKRATKWKIVIFEIMLHYSFYIYNSKTQKY